MSAIRFFKVNSLPAVLQPNSVYFVNTAGILTIYVTNNQGTASLQLSGTSNSNIGGVYPFPVRKEAPKIVGDLALSALSTVALVTRRLYIIPFVTPRILTLTYFRISITSATPGTINIGIYNNIKLTNGNDNPGNLIASVTGLNTSVAQNVTANINFTFQPNTLYWIGLMASSAPTLRAVPVASVASSLGRFVSSNNGVTHLYLDYAAFGLPSIAPTDLVSGSGNIPAIYLGE